MTTSTSLLEQKYTLGAKVAGIGLGTVDYIADTIALDARGAALFDLPADTALPRETLHARIHPEDQGAIDYQVQRLLDPEGDDFIEVTHRIVHGNGRIVWVTARKQVAFSHPTDGTSPAPVSGLVAIIDVTAHKEDQEKVQFLLDELNHRSKNLLTVVQSIARQTFASSNTNSFTERFSDRLRGLARNHDAMVRGNWTHADLSLLVTTHLSAFADIGGDRITVNGPPLKVNASGSQAIGMALHELATNASKYGALSNDSGRVSIEWTHSDAPDGEVCITWRETDGPDVSEPVRSGFGQLVMKDIAAASLNGTVEMGYPADGFFWQLRFPATGLY